jgi:hypothetical protein
LQETKHFCGWDQQKLRRVSRMGYHDIDDGRWKLQRLSFLPAGVDD